MFQEHPDVLLSRSANRMGGGIIWIAAFFAVLGLTGAGLGVAAGVLIVFAVFVVLCRIAVRFFVRHLRKTRPIGLFGGRRRVCR
jgi:hypothetical protein